MAFMFSSIYYEFSLGRVIGGIFTSGRKQRRYFGACEHDYVYPSSAWNVMEDDDDADEENETTFDSIMSLFMNWLSSFVRWLL